MNLETEMDVASTRAKLARMEARYDELSQETGGDEELREATLESLKRYINQFKEDIARFEAHQAARR